MSQGEIFIISAPSGTGKNTLIRLAQEQLPPGSLAHSVSYTTRGARAGEKDGRDYYFVDRNTFETMITRGEFLEWAVYNGEYYGTPREQIQSWLECGTDVILDIDVEGTRQLMEKIPRSHAVFVMPPSYEALESRLRKRGLDAGEEIRQRLRVSLSEIESYGRYHYVIINDDVEVAGRALAAIVLDKRHSVSRQQERVEKVLEGFRLSAS